MESLENEIVYINIEEKNLDDLMPNQKVIVETDNNTYTIEASAGGLMITNQKLSDKPQRIKAFGVSENSAGVTEMHSNHIKIGDNMEVGFDDGSEVALGPIRTIKFFGNGEDSFE